MIKELLKKGWSQKKIANFLGLSHQRVNFWALHEIKNLLLCKLKLKDIYVQRIIRWAKTNLLT